MKDKAASAAGHRPMKVMLVFPPLWEDPLQPYTSLPYLTGHLRAAGVEVTPLDLNIEYFHYFFKPERLSRMLETLARIRDELDDGGKAALFEVHGWDLKPLLIENFCDLVAGSLKTLRSPGSFFHYTEYSRALTWMHYGADVLRRFHDRGGEAAFELGTVRPADAGGYPWDSSGPFRTPRMHDPGYRRFVESHFLQRVREERPDVVGLSCINPIQLFYGLELGALLKSGQAGIRPHVVAGGSQFTARADDLPRFPQLFDCLDSIVLYEGETPLLRLVKALEGGDGTGSAAGINRSGRKLDQLLRSVPNLVLPGSDGKARLPLEIAVEDLNTLATPDYRGLPLDLYLTPTVVSYLQTSRGCYWSRCTYCSIQALQKRYRTRRVELLLEDMDRLSRDCGTTFFYLTDEVVSVSTLRRLAQALVDRGSPYQWICETRFEKQIDEPLCRLLRRAGCRKLMFGLESANHRVLELMDKGIDPDQAARIVEACAGADLAVSIYAIIGFPSETRSEAMETLRFILSLRPHLDRPGLTVYFTPFRLLKGSAVGRSPGQFGLHVTDGNGKMEGIEAPGGTGGWIHRLTMDLFLDTRPERGLTTEEAREASESFLKMVRLHYDYCQGFVEPHEFLYLTRLDKADGWNFPRRVSWATMNLLSEENLVRLRPLTSPTGVLSRDGVSHLLLNLRDGSFRRVHPPVARVLAACDGSRTVEEVLREAAGTEQTAADSTETVSPIELRRLWDSMVQDGAIEVYQDDERGETER